jgi:hypothetical protein
VTDERPRPCGESHDLPLGVVDPDDALLTPCKTNASHPEYDAEFPSCPACFDEAVADAHRREAELHEVPEEPEPIDDSDDRDEEPNPLDADPLDLDDDREVSS